MKIQIKRISFLICLFCFACGTTNAQKKPVKKSQQRKSVVVEKILSTESPVSANEEDEKIWKMFVDKSNFFKVDFPGKPVRVEIMDTFNKKKVFRVNYHLETERAFYIAGYMPLNFTVKDEESLNKLYDIYTKESLDKANVSPLGDKSERVKVKSYNDVFVEKLCGRETVFEDEAAGEFKVITYFSEGKIVYLSVMGNLNTDQNEKDIFDNVVRKFFRSFQFTKK